MSDKFAEEFVATGECSITGLTVAEVVALVESIGVDPSRVRIRCDSGWWDAMLVASEADPDG